jgi:hypothetical protein
MASSADHDDLQLCLLRALLATGLPRGEALTRCGEVLARVGDFSALPELDASVQGPFVWPADAPEMSSDIDPPSMFIQERRFTYLIRVRRDLVVALFGSDARCLDEKLRALEGVREAVLAEFA